MDVYGSLRRASDLADAFAGGGGDPWTRLILASDFVVGVTTFANVTGMQCVIPANTKFVMELDLLLKTTVATNLPRFGLAWTAATVDGAAELWQQSSATARLLTEGFGLQASSVLQTAAGTAPVAAGAYLGGGLFKGTTGPSGPVTMNLQLAAESAASNVATMMAGSEMRYRTL